MSALEELRRGRVYPFTRSDEFKERLDSLFADIKAQVKLDQERYSSDYIGVGLPGLANGCMRKASRLFDMLVMGMPGKDKVEDEFMDNVMISIYTYLYYKMLDARINPSWLQEEVLRDKDCQT